MLNPDCKVFKNSQIFFRDTNILRLGVFMFRMLSVVLCLLSSQVIADTSLMFDKPERFDGTIAFFDCSGFVFQFDGMPADKKALVMTNGHCLIPFPIPFLMLKDGEFQTSQTFDHRRLKIFNQTKEKLILRTQELVYATMTGTDIGIYELNITYQELKEMYGISPLLLSKEGPKVGDEVEVISAYRRKIYRCKVEGIVNQLDEAGRHFKSSIRLEPSCETRNGTSGSPIVLADTNQVVGINNTLNAAGKLCKSDNPCEVSENGEVTSTKGARYGQQTSLLYECLGESFEIDYTKSGCTLTH